MKRLIFKMGCCLYECSCGWWGNGPTCPNCGKEAQLMDWDEANDFNSDGTAKENCDEENYGDEDE